LRIKKQKNPFILEGEEFINKIMRIKEILDQEDKEEVDEDYLVYQPLVYPPGTTPPTPQLIKRMNFIDFNQIL